MAPDQSDRNNGWAVGVLALAAVWFGILVGVSFIATPAKFLAPSLSLPVALDVGRHTFAVFNRTEWILSATLCGLVLFGARSRLSVIGVVILVALVLAETVWLLPLLDSRVGLIIAGQQPAPSNLHMIYIVCEVAKLLSLLLIVIDTAGRLASNKQWTTSRPVRSEFNSADR